MPHKLLTRREKQKQIPFIKGVTGKRTRERVNSSVLALF